jgi:hypothetical protein
VKVYLLREYDDVIGVYATAELAMQQVFDDGKATVRWEESPAVEGSIPPGRYWTSYGEGIDAKFCVEEHVVVGA